MVNNIPVGISFPKKLLKQIDKDREDVSRSRYLLKMIENSNNYKIMSNSQELSLKASSQANPEGEVNDIRIKYPSSFFTYERAV